MKRKMVVSGSDWASGKKSGSSAQAPERKLSYGVVNNEMLMVFVAMMVKMRLTLILNMSTNLLHQIDSFESLLL